MNKAISPDQVRAALTGPIASIRTPFGRDGSVDYDGLRRMIDFDLEAGSKVSLLTAGDSHFFCLTAEEIAEINRVTVEHTAGRALTVACEWQNSTPQAVAFAKFCAGLGADLLMVRPPNWGGSATVESLVEHFAAVAAHIPVMVVTNLFYDQPEKFSLEVIRQLRDRVPGVMAVKDDLSGDFARKLCLLVHDRWAVFSGGGLRNHLNLLPYGCDGFMDRHLNFAPAVTHRYWQAIQRKDWEEARAVIAEIEVPLEDFMGSLPGGRDAAIHGMLEIRGIAGRWRRKPYHSLTDSELTSLRDFAERLGI